MKKFGRKANFAFTIAEILIVMGIIGIVAEMTIPSLVSDVTQKAFAQAQDLAVRRIRVATDQMRTDDLITAYSTNDLFVDQFQKYIKTTKRCDSTHLQDCFSSKIKTGPTQSVNVSDLHTGVDIGQSTYTSPLVGIDLINGTSMILAFNPNCQWVAPYNNTIDTTSCLAIVYDTNGFGKPNQVGKDIALLNAHLNSCILLPGGVCVAESDLTFTPGNEGPYMSDNNYFAGARDACLALGMKLPSYAELDIMYQNRSLITGIDTSAYYWSSDPFGWGVALVEYFSNGGQYGGSRNNSSIKARCIK